MASNLGAMASTYLRVKNSWSWNIPFPFYHKHSQEHVLGVVHRYPGTKVYTDFSPLQEDSPLNDGFLATVLFDFQVDLNLRSNMMDKS